MSPSDPPDDTQTREEEDQPPSKQIEEKLANGGEKQLEEVLGEQRRKRAEKFREVEVETDQGPIKIEEYPGGDMAIFAPQDEHTYFPSEQAEGLKAALCQLEAKKNDNSDR